MKLLLTGVTGFVGRNFFITISKRSIYSDIYLIVRDREKFLKQMEDEKVFLPKTVQIIEGSSKDWKTKNLKVDHLVHCAGTLFSPFKEDYFQTHVEGTVSLLRSVEADKTIVLSSQAASGPCLPNEDEKIETSLEKPLTWYGESKLLMENTLKNEFPDRNYIVLRPPIILGPRDSATLPLFKMVRYPVHFKIGIKTKYYTVLSVYDLCEAICSALQLENWNEVKGKSFFVGSMEPLSDRELIQMVAAVSKQRGLLIPIPDFVLQLISAVVDTIPALSRKIPSLTKSRVNEIFPDRWVVSSNFFRKHFSWTPKADVRLTLKDTYEWNLKFGKLAI